MSNLPSRSRLVAGALSVILGACAHEPASPPPPAPAASPVMRGWNDPALVETLATLRAEPVDPPGTLTSTEALAAALTYNPELALQRAQADIARADLQKAHERKNPILNLTPEHLISTAAEGVSPWVIALALVWPLRTAGKRDLEIEQALAMSDASLLTAANSIWALRTSVRGALCGLELAAEKNQLASEERTLRADLAARLLKQADAGIASRYDAARAQIESDQALQHARESEAALENARFDLAEIMGLPRAAVDQRQVGDTCSFEPAIPANALPDLEAEAVGARLDLRARLAEFRAADATLRGELAKRYPNIDIGPGYTYDQGDRRISLSLSGELPIYNQNDAGIARAVAERARAAAEVEKLQFSVRAGVERAYTLLALRRQQFADAQRIVSESQSMVDRDRERFASGELDQPAVIATRLLLSSARLDALAAKQSLLDATAALEAALQRPLAAPYFDGAAASALVAPPAKQGTH